MLTELTARVLNIARLVLFPKSSYMLLRNEWNPMAVSKSEKPLPAGFCLVGQFEGLAIILTD